MVDASPRRGDWGEARLDVWSQSRRPHVVLAEVNNEEQIFSHIMKHKIPNMFGVSWGTVILVRISFFWLLYRSMQFGLIWLCQAKWDGWVTKWKSAGIEYIGASHHGTAPLHT
jgi:hypothetical protein